MAEGVGTIENLQIEISSKSTTAASGIDKLANSLKNLKTQLGTKALQSLISKLSMLNEALNSISVENLNKLQQIGANINTDKLDTARRKIDDLALSMQNLSGEAKKINIGTVIGGTKPKNPLPEEKTTSSFDYKKVTEFSSSLGQLIPQLSSVTSNFNSTANSVSGFVTSLSGAIEACSGLEASAGEIGIAVAAVGTYIKANIKILQALISVVKKVAKAIYNLTLGKIVDKIKRITSAIQGLMKSLGRIAIYRMMRSLIKSITEAFQEGTQNVYLYSKAIGSDLATSFDRMSSATLKMKNQIGEAAAELIAGLMPVILRVISLITTLANVLSQVFAIFRGKGTYNKAVDVTKSYADAAEGAGKAAKDLKGQLLGFDELNVLNTEQSAGGGGGASGLSAEDMFKQEDVADWIKDIKNAIDAGDWEGAGALLAARINGIIDKWDSKSWGEKIGAKIQGAIELALGFLRNLNFEEIGSKIANAINGFAEKFKGDDFGKIFGALFNNLFSTIYGFFKELNIEAVAEDIIGTINGFFEKANFEKARQAVEIAFLTIFEGLSKIIKEVNIIEPIFEILSNLADTVITMLPVVFDLGVQLIVELATGLAQGIPTLIPKLAEVILTIVQTLTQPDTLTTILQAGLDLVVALVTGLTDSIPTLIQAVFVLIDNIKQFITDPKNLALLVKAALEITFAIMQGIIEALPELLSGMMLLMTSSISSLIEFLPNFIKAGISIVKTLAEGIVGNLGAIADSAMELVMRFVKGIADFAKTIINSGKKAINDFKSGLGIGDAFKWGKDLIQNFIDGIKKKFRELKDTVKGIATTIKDYIGFSEPKYGDLANFHTFAPDMMNLFIKGIKDNEGKLTTQLEKTFRLPSIEGYAEGGFPTMGELFVANEQGAEMVGRIGNRTAVANNDQIVTAIYNAVLNAMSESNRNNNNNEAYGDIYIDGTKAGKIVAKSVGNELYRTGFQLRST